MDRLTKRTADGKARRAKSSTSYFVGAIYEEEKVLDQEVIDRLAEYEDKLESGQMIELPCKRTAKSTLPKYEVVFIDKYGKIVVERFVDEPSADRRLAELKGTGRCKTCKWHKHENIDDGYVCCNRYSPNVTEWTEDSDRCNFWESKE